MTLYNEINSFATAWLKNLVAAEHVAQGVVDDRSIKDLAAADLVGHAQAHFFAGIGVWSHSLRLAGWPDDVPVWTGSCPCQPFSAAGRGGGVDDARHLWPVWFALIQQCRPPVVFGEQVASPAGLAWLDAVRADLEGAGYSFGVSDLCAAGVGAPHIRQRLYFVAFADVQRCEGIGVQLRERRSQPPLPEAGRGGSVVELADSHIPGSQGRLVGGHGADQRSAGAHGVALGLADDGCERRGQVGTNASRRGSGSAAKRMEQRPVHSSNERSAPERLGDTSRSGSGRYTGAIPRAEREGARERQLFGRIVNLAEPASHVGGFWRDAEWVLCRDGKARPIEPGTFPLAHGATGRVGRLHAYGNAIVSPLAVVFIEAVIDILISLAGAAR